MAFGFKRRGGFDRPPSLVFEAFPKVVDVPFHYGNPVTGR
jgi:hypothetical protein